MGGGGIVMDFKFKKSNLNFRVYTSESEPTTPGIENDIVIITSVPMTNWVLSPDKPSGAPRTDGDVWIRYSAEGNTFNALKNDSMQIATISAYQFVDGAWADVTAKSYQNGEWIGWVRYIFNNGTINEGGSWQSTISGGYITQAIDIPTNSRKIFTHSDPVNVSGCTKATFVIKSTSPVYTYTEVGIYSKSGFAANLTPIAFANSDSYAPNEDTELSFTIPTGTTECYFGFGLNRSGTGTATTTLSVKSIKVE